MTAVQLSLNLWQQIEQAQAQPQATDWLQLCLAFDEAMLTLQESERTPAGLKLATAADAINQMADVLAARAEAFGADWDRKPGDGPVMDFTEFVRQSLSLDLSELVGVPELYVRSPFEKDHGDGESVMEVVSKEELLGLIEPESVIDKCSEIETLEYDEDISSWVGILRDWMCDQGIDEVGFLELLDGAGLSVVKVWLALLLGGFGVWGAVER
ncbi:MAG: hypothetical protein WCD18_18780 [Thermosynechococcaceae cyanobacterium]